MAKKLFKAFTILCLGGVAFMASFIIGFGACFGEQGTTFPCSALGSFILFFPVVAFLAAAALVALDALLGWFTPHWATTSPPLESSKLLALVACIDSALALLLAAFIGSFDLPLFILEYNFILFCLLVVSLAFISGVLISLWAKRNQQV